MRFALSDGPGIRTTVFLKGCPLSCPWCHNPESRSSATEILESPERCLRCGACAMHCPEGAVERTDGRFRTVRERCIRCGSCVEVCAAEARQAVGRLMETGEVVREVLRDVPFYEETGGGVTFSGGEPLLQDEFLAELLTECGAAGVHRTVDTTGFAPIEALDRIRNHTDLFLYDLKCMDEARHREFTGVSNRLILENLRRLDAWGKDLVLRIPLLPGLNDGEENLRQTGELAASLASVREVHILPYHATGSGKYERLGIANPAAHLEAPGPEALARAAGILTTYTKNVSIGG